jgi:undecaprenyl-diphosphatase
MPDILKYVVLGLIQGLAEFLPISSTGHLYIAEQILGFQSTGLAYEILLHIATLIAVVWVFRREVWKIVLAVFYPKSFKTGEAVAYRKLFLYLIVGAVGTAAVAFPMRHTREFLLDLRIGLLIVAGMLIVTAALNWTSDYLTASGAHASMAEMGFWRALAVGAAQGLSAILPGISRSGSTIFASLAAGLKRADAARFSFLLSIPAIVGAALDDLPKIKSALATGRLALGDTTLGFVVALVCGVASIVLLLNLIQRARLRYFSFWCIFVAAVAIVWWVFNRT